MKHEAAGASVPLCLAPHVLDEELAAEQVDPQIPVRFNSQIPLAEGDEDRRLRDGVRAEVVQLHSVVFAQRSHESADGDAESPLVEPVDTP